METITEREIATWPEAKSFSLQPRFQAITLEIILRVVFGIDDEERYRDAHRSIAQLLEVVANPLAELAIGMPERIGPIDVRAPLHRAKEPVDRLLYDEVARRRQAPDLHARKDILSL